MKNQTYSIVLYVRIRHPRARGTRVTYNQFQSYQVGSIDPLGILCYRIISSLVCLSVLSPSAGVRRFQLSSNNFQQHEEKKLFQTSSEKKIKKGLRVDPDLPVYVSLVRLECIIYCVTSAISSRLP